MSDTRTCKICGALVMKPKRHRRWHEQAAFGPPGPQGPPGPMGMSEPHARWEDVKAEREGQTKTPPDLVSTTLDSLFRQMREQFKPRP